MKTVFKHLIPVLLAYSTTTTAGHEEMQFPTFLEDEAAALLI